MTPNSPLFLPAVGDDLKKAALAYARGGISHFPLCPGGKKPVIPKCPDAYGLSGQQLAEHARKCSRDGHGHYDATTDTRKITEWWDRWPNANIGVPTGLVTGFWVLDKDLPLGFQSLAALEGDHGKLPKTVMSRTGGGGQQLFFQNPSSIIIRNSAGRLGPNLDVRGLGGYVVVPPSRTTGTYEFLELGPLSPAPAWLVEKLTRPSGGPQKQARETIIGPADASGDPGPIPNRQRNTTLFGIGCALRARGYDRAGIAEALEEANALRCSPPLDPSEVMKITASACRYAPGGYLPPTPEVLEALDAFEEWVASMTWSGRKGPTRSKLLRSIVAHGRQYGQMIPGGVLVNISGRQLAERAGCSYESTRKHLKERLGGVIQLERPEDRAPHEAGAVVLPLVPASAISSGGRASNMSQLTTDTPGVVTEGRLGEPALSQLASLRPSVAGLKRLGPKAGLVIEALLRASGELHKSALADALGMRCSNLTRKDGVLQRLAEAGIVERDGDVGRLLPNWREALEAARQRGAEDEAGAVQRTRHALERARFVRGSTPNDLDRKALARAESAYSEAQEAYRDARDAARQPREVREEDAG